MKLNAKLTVLALAVGVVAGCSDDDDDDFIPEGQVRLIHAVSDAPDVNLTAEIGGITDTLFENFSFGEAETEDVVEGSYDLDLEAELLSGDTSIFSEDSVAIDRDDVYTYIAVGTLDGSDPYPVEVLPVLTQDEDEGSDSVAVVRVGHLAAGAPTVDVYVTAPGATLDPASPTLSDVAYKTVTADGIELAPGDYQVRITDASDDSLLYDSGTVAFEGGDNTFVGAINNVSADDSSPIALLVSELGEDAIIAYDVNTGASVRIAHAATGGAVDPVDIEVEADDGTVTPIDNVEYLDTVPANSVDYLSLAESDGPYDLRAIIDGTSTVAIEENDVEVTTGMAYTVIANGDAVDDDPSPALTIWSDMTRPLGDRALVRLGHFASQQDEVDIYVVASDASNPIGTETPNFENVPFGADTGYVPLEEGTYDIYVADSDDDTQVLFLDNYILNAGELYVGLVVMNAAGTAADVLGLDGLAGP